MNPDADEFVPNPEFSSSDRIPNTRKGNNRGHKKKERESGEQGREQRPNHGGRGGGRNSNQTRRPHRDDRRDGHRYPSNSAHIKNDEFKEELDDDGNRYGPRTAGPHHHSKIHDHRSSDVNRSNAVNRGHGGRGNASGNRHNVAKAGNRQIHVHRHRHHVHKRGQGHPHQQRAGESNDGAVVEKGDDSAHLSSMNRGEKTNEGNKESYRKHSNQRQSHHGKIDNKNYHKKEESHNRSNSNHTKNESRNQSNSSTKNEPKGRNAIFSEYWDQREVLKRYHGKDPTLIRGKIRIMPGGNRDKLAFVTCDRGSQKRDVVIRNEVGRNRALDGDTVYVELIAYEDEKDASPSLERSSADELVEQIDGLEMTEEKNKEQGIDVSHYIHDKQETASEDADKSKISTWRDDEIQNQLWDPVLDIEKLEPADILCTEDDEQMTGRVVYVVPPSSLKDRPTTESTASKPGTKFIVGTLQKMNRNNDRIFFVPNNNSLPKFVTPSGFAPPQEQGDKESNDDTDSDPIFRAEYYYGSWNVYSAWPPCRNVRILGYSFNPEHETLALLEEHNVNHGEFIPEVLRDVDNAVKSGMCLPQASSAQSAGKACQPTDLQWRPTKAMYKGRRDYRSERIFTIDPTTAKDLDDALHIKPLPDGKVEIGVHIADVSHFLEPNTAVDKEAEYRATTVYLVDRTVPMLPRPLCEIACSLNENVERLAFSCVWKMNVDGTLCTDDDKKEQVWYGKTVIKSCARLDYGTAQNIIENKVATGESVVNEDLWPKPRQPTGGHTIDEVAHDIRLMHRVAMERRKLRFKNGALALNGVKLVFKLDGDGSVPELCEPYPIRDSNRLVEEYMLLANFLVAQRLLTHAKGLALIRHHPPPQAKGIKPVLNAAKLMGHHIDPSSSKTLQKSLKDIERQCNDNLMVQCLIEMLTVPMKPAEYIAAGEVDETKWRHYALNIPYYTHFTSPIRRYPDVIVHRLLQATLEGGEALQNFPKNQKEVHQTAEHCNEKRMAAKKAQERSDRVFLSIFLRKHPIESILGIVMSVGEKTFTVFVPSFGISQQVFLDEHDHLEGSVSIPKEHIILKSKGDEYNWSRLDIRRFAKIRVSCQCKAKSPIDVSVRVVGPWED